MLLADAVQAVNGKLYILGGGWSVIGTEPTPTGIAIKIGVPWTEANKQHGFKLTLVDEDEKPVIVQTPIGDRPLELEGNFEAGRPAGIKPGTSLDVVLAVNLGPLPLRPGTSYVWRFFIDNDTKEDWQLAFTTRPAKG